jgi:hypothetical protein
VAGKETSAGEPPVDRAADFQKRGAPASRTASWLEQQAGFVLIAAGAALIALGAVLAERPAVAPLLVVFGAGMVTLGCFYSRIEGALEASKDGIRTVVREIDRLADEKDIPAEAVPELIEEAIDLYEPSSRRPQEVRRAGREAAEASVRREVSYAFERERHLTQSFGAWLRDEGWVVEEVATHRIGFDMLARKDGDELAVEFAISSRPIDGRLVGRVASKHDMWRRKNPKRRIALVVPAEPGVTSGGMEVARHFDLELYTVGEHGSVEMLA